VRGLTEGHLGVAGAGTAPRLCQPGLDRQH